MGGENVPSVRLKRLGKLYTATSGLIITKLSRKGDTMIGKLFKREISLTSEDMDRTALHESGHAMCHVIYDFKLWRVEIFPKETSFGNHLGVCSPTRSGKMWIPSSKWREYARVGCGGYAAEHLFYNEVDEEAVEDDFEKVARLIAKHGKGVSIETIRDETVELLKPYMHAIRAVADELLISRRITGQQVKTIIFNLDHHNERGMNKL
jgi:ATP-dependent Zn protease